MKWSPKIRILRPPWLRTTPSPYIHRKHHARNKTFQHRSFNLPTTIKRWNSGHLSFFSRSVVSFVSHFQSLKVPVLFTLISRFSSNNWIKELHVFFYFLNLFLCKVSFFSFLLLIFGWWSDLTSCSKLLSCRVQTSSLELNEHCSSKFASILGSFRGSGLMGFS